MFQQQENDQKMEEKEKGFTDLMFKLFVNGKPLYKIINKDKNLTCSKKVYVVILFATFMYSTSRSLMHVLDEPTTMQETSKAYNATFPSLTCCMRPRFDYETFEELYEGINLVFENNIRAKLRIWGIGVEQ